MPDNNKKGDLIFLEPDEHLKKKTKEELIQTIKHLTLENEQQKVVIHYQREEIFKSTGHLSDHFKNNPGYQPDNNEKGTLLPLLEALEDEPVKEESSKIRRLLIEAFLDKNSKYYNIVNTFLVILIFFSVICVIMESVPSLMVKWDKFFYWSEIVVVGIFTIEYIINIYVAEDKLKYIFGPWGIIDLIAIMPTYFYLVDLRDIKLAKTLRIVRFLRTLRIMRVLKLAKNTSYQCHLSAKQRVNTLKIDLEIYTTALFTAITIFSTLVYYAERNIPDTAFDSIPSAMWWCLVTITTVGYGDMHPVTFMGKLIAAVSMIIGLALFGILMNVIGKAMMTSFFGAKSDQS